MAADSAELRRTSMLWPGRECASTETTASFQSAILPGLRSSTIGTRPRRRCSGIGQIAGCCIRIGSACRSSSRRMGTSRCGRVRSSTISTTIRRPGLSAAWSRCAMAVREESRGIFPGRIRPACGPPRPPDYGSWTPLMRMNRTFDPPIRPRPTCSRPWRMTTGKRPIRTG